MLNFFNQKNMIRFCNVCIRVFIFSISSSKNHCFFQFKLIYSHSILPLLIQYNRISPLYNYRIDEIRSALGINQLKRILKINSLRRQAFRYYFKKLSQIDGILMPNSENLNDNACHLFIIRIDKKKFGIDRNTVFEKLNKKNIRTSVHYKPLNLFTIFKKKAKIYSSLENSLKIYDQILSLPFYTGISRSEQDMVVNALKSLKN